MRDTEAETMWSEKVNSLHLGEPPPGLGARHQGGLLKRAGGPAIMGYLTLILRNASRKANDVLKSREIWERSKCGSQNSMAHPSPQVKGPDSCSPSNSQPTLFACHFRSLQPVRGTGRLGCSQFQVSSLNHGSFLSLTSLAFPLTPEFEHLPGPGDKGLGFFLTAS